MFIFLVKRSIGCPNRDFDAQKTKKSPARGGAKDKSFGVLIQLFNNGNETRVFTNTVIAAVL